MEQTVSKNYIYRGKILNLRRDDVVSNGRNTSREVVEHRGGCAVFCVKDGQVLLVRQYRYVYGEELIEIPAGKVEEGEDPAVTAARELSEETGYTAEAVRLLYTIYPTPGYTNEKLYIFTADGLKEGVSHPDDGEEVSAFWLPVEEALHKIETGEIKDGKTVIALLSYACGK